MKPLDITLAHSPDSDDAFMFYALATKKVRTPGICFHHKLEDIQSLNQKAKNGTYDLTALSFHAYAYLAGRYALLDVGASFGDGYGPIVVAARPFSAFELRGKTVAVPGELTTAYLVLRLFEKDLVVRPFPFDKIPAAVKQGEVEAGVLIHEGQLTFSTMGLHKVVDLGQWWREQTGLPLPLGGNAVRRELLPEPGKKICRYLRESIEFAFQHREAALAYALQFSREMDAAQADRFIGMYVNSWTLACGERGWQAVRELFERGQAAGLLPQGGINLDFVTTDQASSTASGEGTR
jgi:1,4-dihydroxy-6-naphthoate synthase